MPLAGAASVLHRRADKPRGSHQMPNSRQMSGSRLPVTHRNKLKMQPPLDGITQPPPGQDGNERNDNDTAGSQDDCRPGKAQGVPAKRRINSSIPTQRMAASAKI